MILLVGGISGVYAATTGTIESVDVVENKLVTLIGTGYDSDDDNLNYTWTQIYGDSVALSSTIISEPTFMAPEVINGKIKVLTFKLTVTDALGASSSDTVELIVNPVNHPPTVNAGRDVVALSSIHAMTIFPTVHDADGDELTYSWKQIAGEPIFVESTETKHLTILPMTLDFTKSDPSEFQITVKDGFGGIDIDTIKIFPYLKSQPNKRISIQAGPLQTVQQGDTVTLSATGTTLDDKPISFSWIQINTPAVKLDATREVNVSFIAPEVGDHITLLTFKVTGYSEGNGYAQATAFVNVLPSNNPPIADAGRDQSTSEKKLVKLIGKGSDPDGDSIKYSWSQISGPEVTIYERTTSDVYFFAPDVNSPEQLTFRLKVTDKLGAYGTDETTVNINYVNSAPRAFAGDDKRVLSESQVNIRGNGVDIDGDKLTYSWKQVYGDKVLFDKNSQGFTFTAPEVFATQNKRISFELTVTDTQGQSSSDRVVIFVAPLNSAPTANVGEDVTIGESIPVQLVCVGIDPDRDSLTYSWTSNGMELEDNSNGILSFTTFNVVNDTTITITCMVSDGTFMAYDSMDLTITNVLSLDIIADAGPDRMVNENVKTYLDASRTIDPENQEIFFNWVQSSGEPVMLSSINSPTPSFTTPVVENSKVKVLVFKLTVSDKNGRSHSDSVTITVDPINSPPQASASARQ